jgi:hypothetical protein
MSEELEAFTQELKRHFDVVGEALRAEIRLVAEGLDTLNARVERGFADAAREFEEVKAMIKFSHAELAAASRRS